MRCRSQKPGRLTMGTTAPTTEGKNKYLPSSPGASLVNGLRTVRSSEIDRCPPAVCEPRPPTDRVVSDLHIGILAPVIRKPFCIHRIRKRGARPFQDRRGLRRGSRTQAVLSACSNASATCFAIRLARSFETSPDVAPGRRQVRPERLASRCFSVPRRDSRHRRASRRTATCPTSG